VTLRHQIEIYESTHFHDRFLIIDDVVSHRRFTERFG